jgi:hypothetical protein
LWIDAVAHVAMGRDKRIYRFLHDSRLGRRVLAESHEIPEIVQAVTSYVARRLVERQHALEADPILLSRVSSKVAQHYRRRRRWRMLAAVAVGFIAGAVTLFVVALLLAGR